MTTKIKIALAGNPNSGKTTIFNNLTGARQHVGNYPGVTVEKKEGLCKHNGYEISVIDLPGTYSLTAYSLEEVVARNFIIDEKPDVVVDILDATNLERNLYLATQLMELGVPLILALNMMDLAKARGIEFDIERLSKLLGAPIIPTVGHKNQGTGQLLETITSVAAGNNGYGTISVHYGRETEEELGKIERLVAKKVNLSERYGSRWLSVKLLENDQDVREKVTSPEILKAVEESTNHLERVYGDHPEIVIADRRYGFISGACQEAVRSTIESRHNWSDKIDEVVTNRILGLPIFLGLMYLVFHLTFTLGTPSTNKDMSALSEPWGHKPVTVSPSQPNALSTQSINGVPRVNVR
jgi:ferrous iron transport protein B